jgi:hypothetical protein
MWRSDTVLILILELHPFFRVSAEPQTIREFSNDDCVSFSMMMSIMKSPFACSFLKWLGIASALLRRRLGLFGLSDCQTSRRTQSICIVRRCWICIFRTRARDCVRSNAPPPRPPEIVRHMVVG